MQLGAVIVAAGMSSRMGAFKPMLQIGSVSVAQRIIAKFRQVGVKTIVMVTGYHAHDLETHLAGNDIVFLRNEHYETTQMFDSAKMGLEYIKDKCEKVFFTPVDVPMFHASTLQALIHSNADLAVPVCGEEKGHPIFMNTSLIEGILADQGGCGLKGALERCPADMTLVPVNDPGAFQDADTPEDFLGLVKYYDQLKNTGKRTIYMIRHSQPDFADGKKMCLGKTDIPLGTVGKLQSVLLAEGLKEKKVSTVYCSDLKRSLQTASYLTEQPVQKPEFQEFDCGEWDGFTFEEIKKRWPEVYELRGKDLSYPIPGAEPVEEGKKRFEKALLEVLAESEGDIAIVGHATAIKSFLCGLKGMDPKDHRNIPMDYASVTTVTYDGTFAIEKENETFAPELSEELCERLLDAAGTPKQVQDHCIAVKKQAMEICDALKGAGVSLEGQLISSAALLHDIARVEKHHGKIGGEWIRTIGYPLQAAIMEVHHDSFEQTDVIDESVVLMMADRCVKETEVVPIELRFLESRKKCNAEEALEMHRQRYLETIRLKEKINGICGKEIIL